MFEDRQESRTKKKNRERIVHAARTLFLERGISGTTMIDIAAEAGVERRTLYNYYENKEPLAIEIQVQYLKQLDEAWVAVDESHTGFEQARGLLSGFCAFCIAHPELINYTVQFDHYFRRSYDNPAYESFMKNFVSTGAVLERALEKGLSDGSIAVDPLKVGKIAVTMTQSLMGLAQRIIFRESIYEMEYGYQKEDMRHMVDILLFGLKGRTV